MTDPLIEVMARGYCGSVFDQHFCDPYRGPQRRAQWIEETWKMYAPDMRAALSAIQSAGYAVVPVEPTTTRYVIERFDEGDGSITYVVYDNDPRTFRSVCQFNDYFDQGAPTAKDYADIIVRALNLHAMIAAARPDHSKEAGYATVPVACHDCGRPYGGDHGFPDLLIPDDAWKKIAPQQNDGEGLLCPSCICARLHWRGITCSGTFTSGPLAAPARSAARPADSKEG